MGDEIKQSFLNGLGRIVTGGPKFRPGATVIYDNASTREGWEVHVVSSDAKVISANYRKIRGRGYEWRYDLILDLGASEQGSLSGCSPYIQHS